jgi:hypothetical protein
MLFLEIDRNNRFLNFKFTLLHNCITWKKLFKETLNSYQIIKNNNYPKIDFI